MLSSPRLKGRPHLARVLGEGWEPNHVPLPKRLHLPVSGARFISKPQRFIIRDVVEKTRKPPRAGRQREPLPLLPCHRFGIPRGAASPSQLDLRAIRIRHQGTARREIDSHLRDALLEGPLSDFKLLAEQVREIDGRPCPARSGEGQRKGTGPSGEPGRVAEIDRQRRIKNRRSTRRPRPRASRSHHVLGDC